MPYLDRVDAAILITPQYGFAPTQDPYRGVAGIASTSEEELLGRLRGLAGSGILKRVGFYPNYRPASLPFTTNVVLRNPKPRGVRGHACCSIAHAASKPLIARALAEAESMLKPKSLLMIRNLADFKPGVAR